MSFRSYFILVTLLMGIANVQKLEYKREIIEDTAILCYGLSDDGTTIAYATSTRIKVYDLHKQQPIK